MPDNSLCHASAKELTGLIAQREISAIELLDAHLAQIDTFNSEVNAIITLTPDHARAIALDVDRRLARGEYVGPLAGLPVAHKDLVPTAGIRTTFGSRLFEHHIPANNALIVERLLRAGAVTLGKTNTPEWGAGSQTYNEIFGATLNPYDTSKTCGGSSGGAASALAARLIPIADGSDMGGSLRNPANFCNVVGFRVSPGRVPNAEARMGWYSLAVDGPMARNVEDCALMLRAIAGPDSRSPIAIDAPGNIFAGSLKRDFRGTRIAFSADFGGQIPVAAEVRSVIDAAAPVFEAIGCSVEPACPDFSGADDSFKTLRAWSFAARFKDQVAHHPELFKSTIIWNVQQGLRLTGEDLARAEHQRTQLYQRLMSFFDRYDYLVLPVSQVVPFDVTTEYVTEIDGQPMDTYIDWMKSCYYISATGLPAISVPGGFTPTGLPVGLQIVGRHHADLAVLQLAFAFEQATRFSDRLPPMLHPTASSTQLN